MTKPKIHSDSDSVLLGDAIAHTNTAIELLGRIALRDGMRITDVRASLAGALVHLAQSQRNLHQMQGIRDANNPRRKAKTAAAQSGTESGTESD